MNDAHIVIGNDRFIFVPDEVRKIAVQNDHNVETVTFDCPRYWDGVDMSEMKIFINYLIKDGTPGSYIAENIVVEDMVIHFDWTITRNVAKIAGPIIFLVCINATDDNGNEIFHWNSELNKDMYVSEGLEVHDVTVEQYSDIITQLLTRMDHIILSNNTTLDTSLSEKGLAADAGAVGEALADIIERVEGMSSVEVDASLSEEGKAADAKAVGDALSNMDKEIGKLITLPSPTAADEGKFLRVANGEWSAKTVQSAEGVSF